jgi:orotidine-5'-phosphate decarboxylase
MPVLEGVPTTKEARAIEKLIFALDIDDLKTAEQLVADVLPYAGYVKIGYEFMYLMNELSFPHVDDETAHLKLTNFRNLMKILSGKIFWDAKLSDIPNQVKQAMEIIARYGVRMVTVHANSSVESLRAVVEAAHAGRNGNNHSVRVLAVTLLTSINDQTSYRDFNRSAKAQVMQMATNAVLAGADGVFCSGEELEFLSQFPEFRNLDKVVTGVRPATYYATYDDHHRVIEPQKAIRAGAKHLVVGRPIRRATGTPPAKAAYLIHQEILKALPESDSAE